MIHQDRAKSRTREREREREREIKYIATGTYPQPRGWTTPSSSWRAPGWWRWPPVRDPPLRQGAGIGSRLVFGGYRGLRRRNSRSRFCSGGFGIYRKCWHRGQVKGAHKATTRKGGAPSTLVVASGLFSEIFSFQYFLYFLKIFFVDFQVNWTPFDIHFLRSSKTRKK